jgi:superfamily II DNA/RNA helicase
MPFSQLGLIRALAHCFATPTPIQAGAIPPILQGRDVLVSAPTGSGKTAAFGLPLLQHCQRYPLSRPRVLRGLILVPTRELAAQVGAVLRELAQALMPTPKIDIVFGGVSINPQMLELRGGADIVVATPGRLLDLQQHNALQLDQVEMLVLDEADRLLDMGFAEEISQILALLPTKRQNLFFSATFAPAVTALAQQLLHNPVRVSADADAASRPDITQRVIQVDAHRRIDLLQQLLQQENWRQVLVFVATKRDADEIADTLRMAGIAAAAFHGDAAQGIRTLVLDNFKSGQLRVMVATDVAARGLDIQQLPAVINYDLPRSTDDYTHRIGRTGRAGESGLAISLVDAASEAHMRLIEKRQQQHVPREQIAGFEPTEVAASAGKGPAAADGGGIKGKRKSKKDKLREAAAKAAAESGPAD